MNFANESHQVIVGTKLRLRDLYWWQVTKAVKHCLTCQMADMYAVTRVAPMQPVTQPDRPWKKLGVDFVGPDYSVPAAERYTISLTDYRSKRPEIAFASDLVKNMLSSKTF